ncbi:transmembrane protein 62 [Pyxicephalus adspersus]|uniref:transmembrane protein 62 n=1 Tax=Pyxicephalus adspersus TaxID=30357 RepID=UPI003B5BD9B5
MLKVVVGLLLALVLALMLGSYSSSGRRAQLRASHAGDMIAAWQGKELTNIFWAVQVTDIHVSKFLEPERVSAFESFCAESLAIIQPALVLVTDSFNIAHLSSINNYYRKYSGWQKEGSFHYIHQTPFGNYSFICVDATLTPGPKRPYNFFGIIRKDQMQKLSELAVESLRSNQSVWFGHYPTSTIVSSSPGIRQVMSSSVAYMCGHLHTLGGMAPVLHSQHQQGTLELELGDWMKNRRYRIFAFDHDLFSFIDLQYDEWPAILITNPKSALYSNPAVEPLKRIQHSTHIRVLVFSLDPINSVKVFIDGQELGEAEHSSGPLYVLEWSPETYINGLHEIKVQVKVKVSVTRSSVPASF